MNKKLITKHILALGSFAALLSLGLNIPSARAGGDISGGGGGVVCKNSSGVITSVSLLDLYVAEKNDGRTIPTSPTPFNEQLESMARQMMTPNQAALMIHNLNNLKIKKLPKNQSLTKPYDLGDDAIALEDGCEVVWIAFYNKEGVLTIVSKYFEQLSETHKTALFVHEYYYSFARKKLGDHDSARTREIVGRFFSGDREVANVFPGLEGLPVFTGENTPEITVKVNAKYNRDADPVWSDKYATGRIFVTCESYPGVSFLAEESSRINLAELPITMDKAQDYEQTFKTDCQQISVIAMGHGTYSYNVEVLVNGKKVFNNASEVSTTNVPASLADIALIPNP